MSIESVIPSNHLILCRSLLLPSIFPSIRVFSGESALRIRWPKYWSFSFRISTSNEYSGMISFRIDWFDFLAVQGTLKSLLQHHCLKVSILGGSALFMARPSQPYMTTGKTSSALEESENVSSSVKTDSLQPHGLYPARLLYPRDSPGKNTGVGCHSLLPGIFLTQELNWGLLHCRRFFTS